MSQPVTPPNPTLAQTPLDESICFEAHGLLNHSYDSLDALLYGLTHAEAAPLADQAGAPEVTIVGQTDALLAAHLFL